MNSKDLMSALGLCAGWASPDDFERMLVSGNRAEFDRKVDDGMVEMAGPILQQCSELSADCEVIETKE